MQNITHTKRDVKNERLEQLFGSRTRSQLIRLFMEDTERAFFIREITRILNSQIHSVRRELLNLHDLGMIKVVAVESAEEEVRGLRAKKYYQVNKDFILYQELKSLIEKSNLLIERDMIEQIKRTGNVVLMILTGHFVEQIDLPTDILIVGTVEEVVIKKIVEEYERISETLVRYTIMDENEFNYRKEITDKFLYDILINRNIVIVDSLSKTV